jgi:hypothetical protein
LRRFLGESSLREVSGRPGKAAVLVCLGLCSMRKAARVVNLGNGGYKAVQRACNSFRTGRFPCVNGRPPTLNPDEAIRLRSWVDIKISSQSYPSLFDLLSEASRIKKSAGTQHISVIEEIHAATCSLTKKKSEPVKRGYVNHFFRLNKDLSLRTHKQ